MKNLKQSFYNVKYALIGLLFILGCQERTLDELQPLAFPTTGEVFLDDFTGDLNYAAFGGSDVTAFQIETQETFNNSTQAMRIEVPNADSPDGAFAGGVFFSSGGRDLSNYNALTFYIKASQSATIGELGFGNDLGDNKFVTTLTNYVVNTNWKKVIIPIPDASKLTGEKGLFYFAAGPENGQGYTFYVDEVKFENVGDLGNIVGVISGGQEQVIDNAETGDNLTITGFQAQASLPNGVTQAVNTSINFFTFNSSNSGVVSVSEAGAVQVVDAGTATITASLGDNVANGSIKITSIGAPVAPTVAAPAPPTRDATDVVSLYSNAYTNQTVNTWNTRWQFSTADEFFIQVAGDDVIRYRSLNFVGIQIADPTVNIAAMSTMHIDVWTPDAVEAGSEFKIKLIDFGADGVFSGAGTDDSEHEVTIPGTQLSSQNWVSLEIPMTDFTNLTGRANLAQMVFSGSLPNVYVDNIYFYREPVTPPSGAPTPTDDASNVISVFSDSFTDVAGTDYNPNWGQATVVTQTDIGGNNTLHYANLNYQGIQLGTAQDVSGFGSLHVDYYTTNTTAINVSLISTGVEKAYAMAVPTSGWNSIDIPLTEFTGTGVNLADIIQLKFDDGGSGNGGDLYLDNIYFWKIPAVPTAAAPTPTFDAADVISIFSDAYTNVAGSDLNPNWGQATVVTEESISSNNTLLYTGLNYQGLQFGANQDVSGKTVIHIDYYTSNATSLDFYLICPPNSPNGQAPWEKAYNLTVPTKTGWNSVDIPLSHFQPTVDLNDVFQFKFVGDGNIYVDNLYFR